MAQTTHTLRRTCTAPARTAEPLPLPHPHLHSHLYPHSSGPPLLTGSRPTDPWLALSGSHISPPPLPSHCGPYLSTVTTPAPPPLHRPAARITPHHSPGTRGPRSSLRTPPPFPAQALHTTRLGCTSTHSAHAQARAHRPQSQLALCLRRPATPRPQIHCGPHIITPTPPHPPMGTSDSDSARSSHATSDLRTVQPHRARLGSLGLHQATSTDNGPSRTAQTNWHCRRHTCTRSHLHTRAASAPASYRHPHLRTFSLGPAPLGLHASSVRHTGPPPGPSCFTSCITSPPSRAPH